MADTQQDGASAQPAVDAALAAEVEVLTFKISELLKKKDEE
jgi:hypothetical protein